MGESNIAEIFERLSKIEQTLARIDERTAKHDSAHNDHEARIRALERDADKSKGFVAAIATVASAVGAGLMWILKAMFGGGN